MQNYAGGQFVFVNIPSVAFFEWHPFSLTSNPGQGDDEICIRAVGNFTKKLLAQIQQAPAQKFSIRVDGPYGNIGKNDNNKNRKI